MGDSLSHYCSNCSIGVCHPTKPRAATGAESHLARQHTNGRLFSVTLGNSLQFAAAHLHTSGVFGTGVNVATMW